MTNRYQQFLEIYPKWQQSEPELAELVKEISSAESYLEIGTAEGGSLYYLAPLLGIKSAVCVDLDEDHTRKIRYQVFAELKSVNCVMFSGNSKDHSIVDAVKRKGPYDVVLIDGGHDYATVMEDWQNYGPLAAKYLVFHDIQLPAVKAVWEQMKGNKMEIVHSKTFGFGVLKI